MRADFAFLLVAFACFIALAAAFEPVDVGAPKDLSAKGPFALLVIFNVVAFGWLEWKKRRGRGKFFQPPSTFGPSVESKRV